MTALANPMTFDEALRQCGVTDRTLTPGEKEALDRWGYAVFHNVIDDDWLAEMRAAFEKALAEGKRHGIHVQLSLDEPAFDRVYTQPKVLAAAHHVLRRPLKMGCAIGRDPAKGHGQQALHADWPHVAHAPALMVTSLWLLDDYTSDNGPTRIVPGSHRVPNALPKSMAQPESQHRDQQFVIAPAGSVLVFNSYLLHSGTRNRSGGRRRVLQCAFAGREPAPLPQATPVIPERLSPAAHCILGGD